MLSPLRARLSILLSLTIALIPPVVHSRLSSTAKSKITSKDVVDRSEDPQEVFLSSIDFLRAPAVEIDLRELGIKVADDPTMGNKVEGDIALPSSHGRMKDEGTGLARSSIRSAYRKWPNNEIPYTLSSQYGSYSRSIIAKAMNDYHMKTCIRFVARDPRRHRDYVYIHPDDGCYSLVGRVGGRQPLSLDSGCIQLGTVVHELMHAVGFFHEQSRYDRDQYIDIAWRNVVRGADDQFEKYGYSVIDQLNEPYDYSSIMHYGPYAFSSNGRRTIVARRPGATRMGQRVQFSEADLRKINKLYQCGLAAVAATNRIDEAAVVAAPPSLPSLPSSPATTSAVCEDRNWRCMFWALPVFNFCERKELRESVCPLSCGACTPSPATVEEAILEEESQKCEDASRRCNGIDRDKCSRLPLIRELCRWTCGMCTR